MIFAGQENTFSEAKKYTYIYISKQITKSPEIMKKNIAFGKFYSWGHSNSVLNFINF